MINALNLRERVIFIMTGYYIPTEKLKLKKNCFVLEFYTVELLL